MSDRDKDWLERHYLNAVEQAVALRDQLDLASVFLIPCANAEGGYAEVTVERGTGAFRDRWAVSDGAVTNRSTWTQEHGWRPIFETGLSGAFVYSRDEALNVGHQVAEVEGACIEAQSNALTAEDGGAE